MTIAEQYKGIALWGQQLRSFDTYITGQQEQASEDKAPIDAVYKSGGFDQDGKWVCVSDLKPGHPFIAQYEAATKEQA